MVKFYYYTTKDSKQVLQTQYLDEFVIMLFTGSAEFIDDNEIKNLNLPNNYISFLKKTISGYSIRIPLYDIHSNHIYLIYRENVYPRIYYDNYRFIDTDFYNDLMSIPISHSSANESENKRILSHYDIDKLQKTYYKIFYDSFVVNNYVTSCRRPSFKSGMEHISPYYKLNELYYLAYDWDLTTAHNLSQNEINALCKNISKYDIPAKTLLDHQMYIYDTKSYGLVKHYSLYGSYYINVYLRKYKCVLNNTTDYCDAIRNIDLENQIVLMMKLIAKAPAFAKSHTVYRFVSKDDYLKHLKIGDVYVDPSFMSTTRNPFYYQENYNFGYILIKIKLPQNLIGVALCIEAYSNFPSEEEIILPPTTSLRLDNVYDKSNHESLLIQKKVQKKYEFTWIGNNLSQSTNNLLKMPGSYEPIIENVDLAQVMNDENLKYISIVDRLSYFKNTYISNINNQFICTINGHDFVFNMESYDSQTVYKQFFYYETNNGIMITSANPKYGNINILLELGTTIHLNYYFKYSVSDSSELLDLNRVEWIEWLSQLAYVIGSRNVVIHSNYVLNYDINDTISQAQMKTRYTYSQNIYQYMKYKKKIFDGVIGINSNFDYARLDLLFNTNVNDVLSVNDRDELYNFCTNIDCTNIGDFYIYIVENNPRLLAQFYDKMQTFFETDVNPFNNISYTLDAWMYLYNIGKISNIPSEYEFVIKKGSFKKLIGDKKIPKFKNRLRFFSKN